MTGTVFSAPIHPGKQVECFTNVSEHHQYKATSANQLQGRSGCLAPNEQGRRTIKQQGRWQ
jgi:hypothetical protein